MKFKNVPNVIKSVYLIVWSQTEFQCVEMIWQSNVNEADEMIRFEEEGHNFLGNFW